MFGAIKTFAVVSLFLLTATAVPAQSLAYSNALISLNPAGYWPMHEVAAATPGDVETNYGTLGPLANGYYPDYQVNAGAFIRQMAGAVRNDADTAVFFTGPAGAGGVTNGLFVPHTSPLATLNPPFSVECWIMATNIGTGQGDIWSQDNGLKTAGIRLYYQNSPGSSMVNCLVYNGAASSVVSLGAATLASNQWHHLVLTCDANTNMTGWVDGVFGGTKSVAGKYAPYSFQPFTVGTGLGNQRAFHGLIDEVAVYTNVIADIATHYSDGAGGTAGAYFHDVTNDNPIIYLRMNSSSYNVPAIGTWPVLVNYGRTNGVVVGNGVYTPGTIPGSVTGTAYDNYPTGISSVRVPQFSGVSSFADAGNAPVYNPTGSNANFTVTAVFRGDPTDHRVQSIVGHGINSWELGLTVDGQIVFNAGNSHLGAGATGYAPGDLTSARSYNDGNWHQVVAVSSTNVISIYVDGVLDTSGTPVGIASTNTIPGNTSDIMIGSDPSFTNNPIGLGRQFAGQICEVAFFTNALTPAQVQLLSSNCGIALAPFFIQSPPSTGLAVAGSALTIPAIIGGTEPLVYQWLDQNANTNVVAGTNNESSLNATLAIASVPASWNGNQLVLTVSNACGTTNISVALTVATAPLITNNLPSQVTLAQGQPYTYSVNAIGISPLSYQWHQDGVPLFGQTNSNYAFFAGNVNTNTYYVVIGNAYGSTTSVVSSVTIHPTTPVVLDVVNSPGYKIPDDFSGLSWEVAYQLPDTKGVTGNIFNPANTQLIRLFQNMNLHHLRIGAGTVDNTNYALLNNSDIDNLFGFARAAGLKVIYDGLRLKYGNADTDAVAAQYVWQNYRSLVNQFAIGNEPDEYGWSYSTYLNTWNSFYSTIATAVPGAAFAAPESAGASWNTSFANDESGSGRVALFTTHDYYGGKPTGVTADMAVSNMLSASWVDTLYPTKFSRLSQVIADGYPYRFTEMNDYLGGIHDASDAFASALWALDVLHWWAVHGCSGINFHNNEWIPTDTICLDGNGNFQINPKAYGIRAWDLGGHGSVDPLTMTNTGNLNLTAYAVADSTNLYVTIINKEYGPAAHNAAATIQLNGFQPGKVTAMYLMVADGNVEATNGVTLGGALITNNVPWQGQWTELGSVTNGQFTVTVPAASAAVVKMTVISGVPLITQNLPIEVPLAAGKSYSYSINVNSALPVSYQWYSGTTLLSGQTNAAYTVMADSPGSATYSVVVANADGAITSLVSTVTVIPQLVNFYAMQILGQSPVGYWPLQETNVPAAASLDPNYGTLGALGDAYYPTANSADVTFGQAGALAGSSDTSVAFNAVLTDSYAFIPRVVPALTLRPPFTLECWLKSSSTAFGDLIGEGGSGLNSPPNTGNGGGVRLSYGGNKSGGPNLQLYIYNGNGLTRPSIDTPANSVPLGVWHHCVATFDGTTAYLYVDGVQQSSGTFTMASDTWSPLTIGAGMWQGVEPQRGYTGLEDEVAIYTNVLTATQINNHYLAGIHASSNYFQTILNDHPLLYYRMHCAGYINSNPAFCPVAVNYGSAPNNGTYLSGTVPGGLSGPLVPLLGAGTVAAPINGVFSCIDAGNDPSFNPTGKQPFTAMAWFRTYPSDGRVQAIMSHGDKSSWALNLMGTNGTVAWDSGTGSVVSTNTLNDGNWHFVAGVYDGTNNYLYADGALNNSASASGNIAGNMNSDVFLGGDPDYTSVGGDQRYFAGAIAQAAFFTNALSSSQIQSVYQAGTTSPPPMALAIEHFGTSQMRLNWNYGTLQSATNVAGPYNDVFNASPPYTVTITNAQEFYRIRGD